MRTVLLFCMVPVFATGCGNGTADKDMKSVRDPVAGDAATNAVAAGTGLRAVGQEPGWIAYVVPGHRLDFLYNYGEQRVRTPVPQVQQVDGTVVYHAITEAHDLRIEFETAACSDAMSGAPYPATVHVELDGTVYHGCGETLIASAPSGRLCFRNTLPEGGDPATSDVQSLTVDIDGLWASGRYDWLPAQKDARRGTFQGVLDGNAVLADYEFMQEGTTGTARIVIRLEASQAVVSGGPEELGLAATLAAAECATEYENALGELKRANAQAGTRQAVEALRFGKPALFVV